MEIYIQNRQTGKTTNLVRNCIDWLNKSSQHRATIFCLNQNQAQNILSMLSVNNKFHVNRVRIIPASYTHFTYERNNSHNKYYYDEFDFFNLENKGIDGIIKYVPDGYYTTTPKVSTKECLYNLFKNLSDFGFDPNIEKNYEDVKFFKRINSNKMITGIIKEEYDSSKCKDDIDCQPVIKEENNVKREYIVDMAFRIYANTRSQGLTIFECFSQANDLFDKYLK